MVVRNEDNPSAPDKGSMANQTVITVGIKTELPIRKLSSGIGRPPPVMIGWGRPCGSVHWGAEADSQMAEDGGPEVGGDNAGLLHAIPLGVRAADYLTACETAAGHEHRHAVDPMFATAYPPMARAKSSLPVPVSAKRGPAPGGFVRS
jgi:hypothetical protein